MFLAVCKRTGLDPFLKQIHAVMRFDKSANRKVMTIQVGIDGFRLLADRTGQYVPGREPSFTYDEKGNLVSATAYVKKYVAGEWHEVASTVRLAEFQGDSSFWRTMPHHQLGKVAEAHALRRAFPADLSGLYTPDEMAQADTPSLARVNMETGEVLEPGAPEDPERAELIQQYGRLKARAKAAGVSLQGLTREMTADEIRTMIAIAEPKLAAAEEAAPAADTAPAMVCSEAGCGKPLTKGQYEISLRAYNSPLCPDHQKGAERAA
jgi:phage recombination protein Bet